MNSAISRNFRERLALAFTMVNKMARPDFFTVCRIVTSPRNLLATQPFLRGCKGPYFGCIHKKSGVDCADILHG